MSHTRSVRTGRSAAVSLAVAAGLIAALGATALPAHAATPSPSSLPNLSGCTVSYLQAESHQPNGALLSVYANPPYVVIYIGNPIVISSPLEISSELREYNVSETTRYLTCVI